MKRLFNSRRSGEICVRARTAELKEKEARIAVLESRLEALELRNNHAIQITAAESLSDNLWQK